MKSRLFLVAILTALMFYATAPLSAQGDPFLCDLPTLQKAIDVYISELGKLKDSKETDVKNISNSLQEMANTANIIRATCDELVFMGKSQKLIGPVEIPSGTYRATLATEGYGIVSVIPSQGECGEGTYSDSTVFNISKGEGVPGAEAIFISKGCTTMIQIENARGDWSLKFERIDVGS